ncbi:MAG: heavy metal translocating P-type ATPase, partial [Methanobacteriota archaeon]
AARNGILIKGGAYLEKFDTVDVLALDKTGTVTVGKPRVHKIITVNGASKEELLSIAASMESRSEHPLAEAILQYARRHRVTPSPVGSFEALTGRGIRGEIGGKTYFLGNHRLFEESGWCDEQIHPYLEKFKNQQHTAVILGSQEKVLGVIAIADAPRKGAAEAIQRLRKAGVKKFVMVTGDNQSTAEAIARELGIDEVRAELLPEDKVKVIQELKAGGQCVAMVGDGINDAPALATADIGVSMGASATDTALETADITLMNDDLTKLAVLKKLSRKTLRIIQQNIFLALFLKGIFVVLAIPGLATLWMAVFADMGASLLVVFNGLRVLGNRN